MNSRSLGIIASGLSLGFVLASVGFSDFSEMQKMLSFTDWRMVSVFAGAVSLLAISLPLLPKNCQGAPRPLERGTVIGAAIFGLGWAICGACPAIPFVQLGEGKIFALLTLVGVFAGTWGYERVHQRYLKWDRSRCSD